MRHSLVRAAGAATMLLGLSSAAPAPEPQEGAAERLDCIDFAAVTSRRAESADTILFDLGSRGRYRNRLPGRCPGLASARISGALAFDVQGGRLCRGDRVRVVDSWSGGTGAAYRNAIPCPLGAFERIPDPEPQD